MSALGPGADVMSDLGPPLERPVMRQRWNDVVFLHWRFEPGEVQRLLPPGVEVDVFDGSAWVGLVPFRMQDISLPGLGRLPFGTFPEVNVRTYVRCGERRGVWFFSLDIDLLVPTAVARSVYRLPYCCGRVDHVRVHDLVSTKVERRWPRRERSARAAITVRVGEPVAGVDPLVRFLTARWGLIAAPGRSRPRWAPVAHPAWPLHRAQVLHLEETLLAASGLRPPTGDAHVLWSPGVDVGVGRPVRV